MMAVMLCLLVVMGCWGLGAVLDRLGWVPLPSLRPEGWELDGLWRVVLGTGVGMAVAGTLVLVVGAVALPAGWLMMAVTVGLAGAGLVLMPWKELPVPCDWVVVGLVGLSLVAVVAHGLVAFFPELDIDELTYHLSAPKAWQLAGRIRQLPFEPTSDFHFHSQMVSLWSLLLVPSETIAPRLLELARTALAAVGAGVIAARWGGSRVGALVTALLLLHEDVARYAVTAQIDAGQSLYAVLGLGVLGRWLESPQERRWAVLGAALLGVVLAVKNVGWFLMGTGLVAAGVVRLAQRWEAKEWRGAGRDALCLLLPWLITAGPWIVRCAINTGNPLYPFWSQVFPVNEASAPGYYWLYKYYEPPPERSWRDFLPDAGQLYVVRSNVRLTNANGAMLWALMGLLMMVLLRRRERVPAVSWLLALTAFLLIPAQLKSPFGRFFIASSFVAVCAGVPAVWRMAQQRGWWRGMAVAGGVVLLLLASTRTAYVMRFTQPGLRAMDAWEGLPPLGLERRLAWLEEHEPWGVAALEAVQGLPPGSLPIVSVTSHAILLMERPFLPNVPCVAQEVVTSLTRQGWSDEQIVERLEREGITHIVTTTNYAAEERLQAFARKHLELVQEREEGVWVYAVRSP